MALAQSLVDFVEKFHAAADDSIDRYSGSSSLLTEYVFDVHQSDFSWELKSAIPLDGDVPLRCNCACFSPLGPGMRYLQSRIMYLTITDPDKYSRSETGPPVMRPSHRLI